MTEAISTDLSLDTHQIGNSNILSLLSTLIIRLIIGPVVDAFGPRNTLAALLVLGAIPSALVPLIKNVSGLYALRFFIGLLGGTFVPCQVWSVAFFSQNVVGRANALVGGWGNFGGGVTFLIMPPLFERLRSTGLSMEKAWRLSFVIVPVPILFLVAGATLLFGVDHPLGKWRNRDTASAPAPINRTPSDHSDSDTDNRTLAGDATPQSQRKGSLTPTEKTLIGTEVKSIKSHKPEPADEEAGAHVHRVETQAESLTFRSAISILISPTTLLPSLLYLSSFGFELCMDANLASTLYASHESESFTQLTAGQLGALYGMANIIARPVGGWLADVVFVRHGTRGKKLLAAGLTACQGILGIALGLYVRQAYNAGGVPALGTQIGLIALMAVVSEAGSGACFALVPHCAVRSPGLVTGVVGASGNLGGIIFGLMFRYQAAQACAMAWVASGAFALAVATGCAFLPSPRA